MTAADLGDLFVKTLLREAGGNRRGWRAAMGKIRVYSLETHAHCNWSITPSGSALENAWIEKIADRLRGDVPIVGD
ncbi:hypothetical protein AB2M62_00065 [Sphingomonas sp. MMS12-HWE2-04]|uniref:hypothetical protein n=1 Tax=Sphingomonas sp. MMS12-HWE2-04 TaxID=3234199 RepID=UPI00384EE832